MKSSWSLALVILLTQISCVTSSFHDGASVGGKKAATVETVVTGTLRKGEDFAYALTNELTFSLKGGGPWNLTMYHRAAPDADLIYAVNPPYRFSGHLIIGEGYNATARSSATTTPRKFSFLYRAEDAAKAGLLLDKILWPKSDSDLAQATEALAQMPVGTGRLEIQSVKYETPPKMDRDAVGDENGETIKSFKFKLTFSVPAN